MKLTLISPSAPPLRHFPGCFHHPPASLPCKPGVPQFRSKSEAPQTLWKSPSPALGPYLGLVAHRGHAAVVHEGEQPVRVVAGDELGGLTYGVHVCTAGGAGDLGRRGENPSEFWGGGGALSSGRPIIPKELCRVWGDEPHTSPAYLQPADGHQAEFAALSRIRIVVGQGNSWEGGFEFRTDSRQLASRRQRFGVSLPPMVVFFFF